MKSSDGRGGGGGGCGLLRHEDHTRFHDAAPGSKLPVRNRQNDGQPRGHKPYDLYSGFSTQLIREAKLCF